MEIFLPFIGGLLIAIASSSNYILCGKITGFSGMFWSLISLQKNQILWKLIFVCSFILTGSLITILNGIEKSQLLDDLIPDPKIQTRGLSFIGFCIAGFLVGFGTKMSNGCTSGHGVCGLPRFSKRSWVAVMTFFSTAMAVANVRHNHPFLEESTLYMPNVKLPHSDKIFAIGSASLLIIVFLYSIVFRNRVNIKEIFVAGFSGSTFAFGLILSGMVKRDRILNFLIISENWDPSLAIVLATTVLFNMFSFNIVQPNKTKPMFTETFTLVTKTSIDAKLVIGAFIFGVGWGISGLCPGPAILNAQYFLPQIMIGFLGCMVLGNYVEHISEIMFEASSDRNRSVKTKAN